MLPFEESEGLPFEMAEDKTSAFYSKIKDEALGVWDTAAGILHDTVHGVQDPVAALAKSALGIVPDAEQEYVRLMEQNTFKPVSEAGERNLKAVGEFGNRYLLPLTPLAHLAMPRMPKAPKELPVPRRDFDAALREQEVPKPVGVVDEGVPLAQRTNESQQLPLFDQPEQGRVANPYEASIGEWRVDENGIPIRADLSMDAQNVQAPLQRHLWGDELENRVNPIGQAATLEEGVRQFNEQPVQGGIPLTQAIDDMPWAQRRGAINSQLKGAVEASGELDASIMEANSPFRGLGRDQAGAINMDVFSPDFQKIKKIGQGLTLIMQGHTTGPRILAVDEARNIVGEVKFSHDTWARGPLPTDNLEAGWVTTDPKKTSAHGMDADRLAPTEKSQYKGLSAEMYKFAAEQGNDIVASSAQTPEGKAMWDKFEKHGVSQGKVIRSPGNRQMGGLYLGPKTPKPNTVTEPRSPELIAAKKELAAKAAAIKVKDTQYERVNTLEEALASVDDIKDMTRAGANELRSGAEAVLRTNTNNKLVNFVRTTLQKARNEAEVNSKEYITNKQNGIIRLLKDLSETEREDLAGMLLALDRNQKPLTPEIMDKLGMTEGQRRAAVRIQEALETRYTNAVKALGEQGFAPFAQRKGYFPSMFSGAYTSLVGYTDSKGKWHTKSIAQADTSWQHKQAVESYKGMGKEYSETIPLRRTGLNSYVGNNRTYNGFADVVNNLAKYDEKFAKAKAIADQHAADKAAALYRFDVHELKKGGVKGSLGDRPWLSKKENTKQMFEALVDYLEQGFRYDSLQAPLNDIGKLTSDPKVQAKLPNTAKFIEKHVQKITGENLNPVGAATNWIMDKVFETVGLGPHYPNTIVQALADTSTTLMMGMFNMGFGALQLLQLPQAMALEGARARPVLGLPHQQLAHSAFTAGLIHPIALALSKYKPELAANVPKHLKEAFEWSQQRGMFDYSEAELVKNLNKSKVRQKAEAVANATISVPEKMTRPVMFMFMADLFNKAGFVGEEALLRAQAATDYAMTHYHADERPGIYQALGQAGKALGALTTFKHNLVEQTVSTTLNAKKNPEAFLVGAGLGLGLYGLMGLPGTQEASQLAELLTGKNMRELILDDADKPNLILDGAASVYSGVDIQSRVAMSSLVPDSALQATPHASNMWNMLSAAVEAGVKQDEASLRQLLYKTMPSSARNVYEAEVLTDETGWVRNTKGELKTERPRTSAETDRKKYLGLRPLDERLQSENLWTQKKRKMDTDKKLRELSADFANAVRLGSPVDKIVDKYIELGGDPQMLMSSIPTVVEQSGQTPKQRLEGVPDNSLSSIRRWQSFNE